MERIGVDKGILKVAYNDRKIAEKVKAISGIDISRRTVGHCRKELGVADSYRRIKTYYPPIDFDYSRFFPCLQVRPQQFCDDHRPHTWTGPFQRTVFLFSGWFPDFG